MSIFEKFNENKTSYNRINIIVRSANKDDIQEIAKIRHSRESGDVNFYAKIFKDQIDSNNCKIYVASYEESIIAYAKVNNLTDKTAPSGYYLSGIVVLQKYRGMGVATALTKKRIEEVKKISDKIYYISNEKNHVSIKLHKKFGFNEVYRDKEIMNVKFTGGPGILFKLDLVSKIGP